MNIGPGDKTPSVVNALIEIPKGSRNKYELDKTTGLVSLDRVLYSSVMFPGDYGMIPDTLWDDGDPMDILVLVRYPTFPGCCIAARPVGLLNMEDTGDKDDKVLAVPVKDPFYNEVQDLSDLPQALLDEIAHFFSTYTQLQPNKKVNVLGWQNAEAARQAVERGIKLYQEKSK